MRVTTKTAAAAASPALVGVLLLAAACSAVGPDYRAPDLPLPTAWREPAGAALPRDPAATASWWADLADPTLDRLVERALHQGLDVRESLARVREARALRGVSAADQFPTLDARAGFKRYGDSDNTPLGSFVPDSNEYAIGFDASWEIDLWGRVRRSVEAADADLAASEADARDVMVTVVAETAQNYVSLRAFQQRVAIAQTNVQLQEQTLGLARGRYEAGLVGERDVAQAATIVETTRARLPALELGARVAENRLAVLLGLAPGALADELAATGPIPVPPVAVAVGVPADLLRRRPDVRRAERHLAAETARIGVAEGDLYPRLTLFGSIGLSAAQADDLFDRTSDVFSFGPSLRWNVFDAGKLRDRVAAQDARAEQALVQWERAILDALEEGENAMAAFVREQLRHRSLVEAATQSRRAVELAQSQYAEGLSDFQTVLDSERTQADLEDDLAQNDAAITRSFVILYKALGGGWSAEDVGGPLAAAQER